MNSSTLPPLLCDYLPEYGEKKAVVFVRSDKAASIVEASEQLEQVKNSSNGVERKPKHIRTMAHKRHFEAEEKASKEREEKALHTLKMWNIVKENEHKKKQKMLKDRVALQHEMIRKQDKLIHEKYEQERREKQNSQARTPKQKLTARPPQKVQHRTKQPSKQTDQKPLRPKTILKPTNEEATKKTSEEEKRSEHSMKLDVFSEEDLSEFLEKSTMEDADFHELQYQPLHIQLERLFGDEADGYLNPTVKESPRKTFDLAVARKKGQHGAAALWEALRAYSRQKLVNKDALIMPDVKNAYACFVRECLRRHITPVKRNFVSEEETPGKVNLEESDILKDVKYRRHRQELMYRIAHINKDKTKLLFQVIGQPHYTEVEDADGIRRYYPEEEIEERLPVIKLPEIYENATARSTLTTGNARLNTKEKEQNLSTQQHASRSNLVFLTEKKAICKGQFAKRLNKEEKEDSDLKLETSVVTSPRRKTQSPGFTERIWEPLSMEALLDHQVTVFERQTETAGLHSSQIWNVCT